MSLPSGWNIGDPEKTHEKEGFENSGSRPMIRDPATALLLDMVFHAAGVRMPVKVEAPMEIVLNRGMVPYKQNNIKPVNFEIRQRHSWMRIPTTK